MKVTNDVSNERFLKIEFVNRNVFVNAPFFWEISQNHFFKSHMFGKKCTISNSTHGFKMDIIWKSVISATRVTEVHFDLYAM